MVQLLQGITKLRVTWVKQYSKSAYTEHGLCRCKPHHTRLTTYLAFIHILDQAFQQQLQERGVIFSQDLGCLLINSRTR